MNKKPWLLWTVLALTIVAQLWSAILQYQNYLEVQRQVEQLKDLKRSLGVP